MGKNTVFIRLCNVCEDMWRKNTEIMAKLLIRFFWAIITVLSILNSEKFLQTLTFFTLKFMAFFWNQISFLFG